MLTSGGLSGASELLASWIAKDRNKNGHYFTSRVPKMAAYGAFISAPLGHILISILQKMFAGRTSLKAKILQILVSNLIVSTEARFFFGLRLIMIDCSNPKHCVPRLDGSHRRCTHNPPGPRDLEGRIHARNEGQLDLLAIVSGICAAVLARAHLGAVLQHCGILHWDLH